MIRVGIIGFGFMGRTHVRAYAADARAVVTAIAESDRDRMASSADGSGPSALAGPISLDGVRLYDSHDELLDDDEIDAVSICVPTPQHANIAIAALERGRHVLVEKPLALRSDEARTVADAAEARPELICMPAMCMRFWPGWTWLKSLVDDGRFGDVQAATFTRLGAVPEWGGSFYRNAELCGGAILDLHIHDADFARHCFGDPDVVEASGSIGASGGLDHVVASYRYRSGPAIVTAEGAWMSGAGFPFSMCYRVDFERATAEFDSRRETPLLVWSGGDTPECIDLPERTGYEAEVAHFLDLMDGTATTPVVTINDGVEAVALVERAARAAVG